MTEELNQERVMAFDGQMGSSSNGLIGLSTNQQQHQQLGLSDIQARLKKFWRHTISDIILKESAEVDIYDMQEILMVPEYAGKISKNLLEQERTSELPKPSYMFHQQDINEKMRAILVDWIIEVHLKFKLEPETLFLTVSLIDRYL